MFLGTECRDFEIPLGFESVQGSEALTREAVLENDQELWFFKLPKNVRASLQQPDKIACRARQIVNWLLLL